MDKTQANIIRNDGYINIHDSNSINIIENLSDSNNKMGRYLYGDYSIFDENKNFIHILKDYVSIINNILTIYNKINELEELEEETYKFQKNIQNKFTDFTKSIESTIFDFYSLHHSKVLKVLNETSNESKKFFDTKNSLLNSVQGIETEYTRNMKKYQEEINNKINDYLKNLIKLFQIWLAKGSANLPTSLVENLENTLEIRFIDTEGRNSVINTSNSIILNSYDLNKSIRNIITYSFSKQGSLHELFSRRKLADFNFTNINFPIGYKVSISDKLKRSFKLSSKIEENKQKLDKEPENIPLDNYYLSYIRLERNKKLVLGITNENTDIKSDKLIEINLILSNNDIRKTLTDSINKHELKDNIKKNDLLQIFYSANDEKRNINTVLIDFFDFIDFKKIFSFCFFIIDTLEKIIDPLNLSNNFKLEYIKFNDKKVVDCYFDKDQKKDKIYYDKILILLFMEIIAQHISPIINRIRDKSPVRGELILRYEMEGHPRNEFVVKDRDIIDQLNNFEEGKKIMEILKF